jgi:hypothetical protein
MSTSSATGHVIVRSPTSLPEATATVPPADRDVEFGRKYDGDAEDNDDCGSGNDGCRLESETDAAAAADGKMDDDDNDEALLPFPEYEAKSLLILRQTTRPRNWCLAMITWPYPFESFVLFTLE